MIHNWHTKCVCPCIVHCTKHLHCVLNTRACMAHYRYLTLAQSRAIIYTLFIDKYIFRKFCRLIIDSSLTCRRFPKWTHLFACTSHVEHRVTFRKVTGENENYGAGAWPDFRCKLLVLWMLLWCKGGAQVCSTPVCLCNCECQLHV